MNCYNVIESEIFIIPAKNEFLGEAWKSKRKIFVEVHFILFSPLSSAQSVVIFLLQEID